MRILIALLMMSTLIPSKSFALDGGFKLIGGLGLSRFVSDVSGSTGRSTFAGWGPSLEAGVELPFSQRFGASLSAEYGRMDLLNTLTSSTYAETALYQYTGAKLMFNYGAFSLGGGARQAQMELKPIPGTSKISYSGLTNFAATALSFDYKNIVRASAEAAYETGAFDSEHKVGNLQIGLKLTILVSP